MHCLSMTRAFFFLLLHSFSTLFFGFKFRKQRTRNENIICFCYFSSLHTFLQELSRMFKQIGYYNIHACISLAVFSTSSIFFFIFIFGCSSCFLSSISERNCSDFRHCFFQRIGNKKNLSSAFFMILDVLLHFIFLILPVYNYEARKIVCRFMMFCLKYAKYWH